MSKAKENPNSLSDLKKISSRMILGDVKRNYEINEAAIKDDFCNYSYSIIDGIGVGDRHNVKGKSGTVENDMNDAFGRLRVHLAFMDDIFKHSKTEIDDIDNMHNDQNTLLYDVTGFKISGGEDNESVILIGNKYVSAGGRFNLETPKISIDDSSSYKWYNELKKEINDARLEVSLYKEGKYIPIADQGEEDKEDPAQIKMSFKLNNEEIDADFKNAEM